MRGVMSRIQVAWRKVKLALGRGLLETEAMLRASTHATQQQLHVAWSCWAQPVLQQMTISIWQQKTLDCKFVNYWNCWRESSTMAVKRKILWHHAGAHYRQHKMLVAWTTCGEAAANSLHNLIFLEHCIAQMEHHRSPILHLTD